MDNRKNYFISYCFVILLHCFKYNSGCLRNPVTLSLPSSPRVSRMFWKSVVKTVQDRKVTGLNFVTYILELDGSGVKATQVFTWSGSYSMFQLIVEPVACIGKKKSSKTLRKRERKTKLHLFLIAVIFFPFQVYSTLNFENWREDWISTRNICVRSKTTFLKESDYKCLKL